MRGDLTCRLPAVLGHEGAGVVEQVGADVARFAPGDDVVMMWRPRCGHCEYCATGRPALCASSKRQVQSGGLLDGTTRLSAGGERVHHLLGVSCFAEYAVVNQESLVHIPAGTPPEIAAITGCAVITGVGAVLNVAGSAAGQACLVVGAGGVGLSAVMGAQLVGAYPIIVADIDDSKLEFARSLGATQVVNSAEVPLEEAVAEIAPGGVSWAFEAVGASATVRAAMASLRPGGTTVAIGLGSVGTVVEVALNDLVQRDKRLVGSLYGSSNTTVQIPRLLELHAAGRLPLDRLLGQRFDLEHINEAYSGLAARALGRAVITMDGSA
jgi:Zn-dependent alcohol dehydrogenase